MALVAALAAASAARPAAEQEAAPAGGMFEVYAENRREGIPNLITEDFVLLAYSMLLQNEVERIEQGLQDDVRALAEGLATALAKADHTAPGAKRAQAFAATLVALGRGEAGDVPPEVAQELALVEAAAGVGPSAVTGLPVDFSQMTPRGRYTRTPEASRYFRVVRYAGALLFPLRASAATQTTEAQAAELTAAAVLMSRAVHAEPALRAAFARITTKTEWLFGRADDLTVTDYAAVRPSRRGGAPTRQFLVRKFARRRPEMVSAPVTIGSLEPGLDARDALLGWRLLPARITPDRVALAKLVYGGSTHSLAYTGSRDPRSLTTVAGVGPVRGFPLADDLLALAGSSAAQVRLREGGEHEYAGYDKAFAEARQALARPNGLAGDHLAIVRAIVSTHNADADVRLNTAAGLWTLDKHREVLYAKQSYTGVGKGVRSEDREHAWLDPAVETYEALRKQVDRIAANLPKPSESLRELAVVLDRCAAIARLERKGSRPGAEDAAFLNNLDTVLREMVGRDDGPIATDVHTDTNSGMTLVQALAAPTIVEASTGESVARGALFTHVEFRQPMSDRLTDEAWAERVKAGVPEAQALSARLSEAFAKRMGAYATSK